MRLAAIWGTMCSLNDETEESIMHPSSHALAETLNADRRHEAAERRTTNAVSAPKAAPRWWRLRVPVTTPLAGANAVVPRASA